MDAEALNSVDVAALRVSPCSVGRKQDAGAECRCPWTGPEGHWLHMEQGWGLLAFEPLCSRARGASISAVPKEVVIPAAYKATGDQGLTQYIILTGAQSSCEIWCFKVLGHQDQL